LPTSAAPVADWLLDTGPLVALLSPRDDAHAACVDFFSSLRGRLFTSEAVLTEAAHLCDRRPGGAVTCVDFFLRGAAVLVPLDARRLAACRALMVRYADVPMDLADATLVALADQLSVGQVLTLDLRGFSAYRWRRNKRFTIAP
jgi:predicted nucleic acid-binding protein